MTLAQLRYIVAVDTYRHFARAAEHCHVTQPTLSMQLQKVERQLGLNLFDRRKQPVEPTDVGKQLIAQARLILREVGRMREIVEETRGGVGGELRVGIIPTLAPYLLPRFIGELKRRQPTLSLSVEELRTEPMLEAIRTDRLDAGVIASSADHHGMDEIRLFEEPFVGYVSEGHRLYGERELRVQDLRLDDMWLLNEGHCFRGQVLELCNERSAATADRPFHFESGNLETLERMVEAGGGMTLLPALATDGLTEAERKRVRPFAGRAPTRIVRVVAARAYPRRSLLDAFVKEMLAAVPAGLVEKVVRPRG